MADTNNGGGTPADPDLVTRFLGTQACAPQVGTCSSHLCRRPIEADGLCERHIRDCRLLDVRWLSKDEAIVTWAFEHSSTADHEGFTSVSVVWVDRCPADRSVGIDAPYYEVNSDAPAEVDELVAEAAAERDDGRWDDFDEDRGAQRERQIVESRLEAL
jgi:hypothetical protein